MSAIGPFLRRPDLGQWQNVYDPAHGSMAYSIAQQIGGKVVVRPDGQFDVYGPPAGAAPAAPVPSSPAFIPSASPNPAGTGPAFLKRHYDIVLNVGTLKANTQQLVQ